MIKYGPNLCGCYLSVSYTLNTNVLGWFRLQLLRIIVALEPWKTVKKGFVILEPGDIALS